MWIFNTNALICGAAGISLFFVSIKWNDSRELAVIVSIIGAMLFDVVLRFSNEESHNPSIDPEAGGHVWFVPVWGVGLLLLTFVGLSHFHII